MPNNEELQVDAEIAKLSARASKLDETFNTAGWKEIIFPGILAVRNIYNEGLIRGKMVDSQDPNNERILPDDELRAVIKTCGWMLSWETDLETTSSALAQAIDAAARARQSAAEPAPESDSGSPLVPQTQ